METMNEAVVARIYVALELSKSKWVVAIRLPGAGTTSLYQVPGGDLDGLMTLLTRARLSAEQRGFAGAEVCSCYEARYDGFWLHRALEARAGSCS